MPGFLGTFVAEECPATVLIGEEVRIGTEQVIAGLENHAAYGQGYARPVGLGQRERTAGPAAQAWSCPARSKPSVITGSPG